MGHVRVTSLAGERPIASRSIGKLCRFDKEFSAKVWRAATLIHRTITDTDYCVSFHPVSTILPQVEQPPLSYARLCWAAFVAASVGWTSQAEELPGENL
jgi:hypothetical protein